MITTDRDETFPDFRGNRLLQGLAAFYAAFWGLAALAPSYRFDWFLENLLVLAVLGLLAATYRKMPLSDLSYILITVFMTFHTIGSHYTYAEVPAGFWARDAFGWERNHYDRAIHFTFGLLIAYPFREIWLRGAGLRGGWTYFASFTLILTCSAGYEIIEWIVALIVSPEAAFAYLGTQGDVFDAQKDSSLAILGAFLSLGLRALLAARTAAAVAHKLGNRVNN